MKDCMLEIDHLCACIKFCFNWYTFPSFHFRIVRTLGIFECSTVCVVRIYWKCIQWKYQLNHQFCIDFHSNLNSSMRACVCVWKFIFRVYHLQEMKLVAFNDIYSKGILNLTRSICWNCFLCSWFGEIKNWRACVCVCMSS